LYYPPVKVDYVKIFCIDETVCTAGEANQGSTIVFENYFYLEKEKQIFSMQNSENRMTNEKMKDQGPRLTFTGPECTLLAANP